MADRPILADLARIQALFQARAIAAAMGSRATRPYSLTDLWGCGSKLTKEKPREE